MSDKISEITASSFQTTTDSDVGSRRFNSGDNPWHEGDENVIDTDEEPVRRRRLLHLPATIGTRGLVSHMSPPTMHKIGETALLTSEPSGSLHNKGNKTNKKEKAKKAKKTVKYADFAEKNMSVFATAKRGGKRTRRRTRRTRSRRTRQTS
jgi:hypothetical protein